jgi:hypothetical protein
MTPTSAAIAGLLKVEGGGAPAWEAIIVNVASSSEQIAKKTQETDPGSRQVRDGYPQAICHFGSKCLGAGWFIRNGHQAPLHYFFAPVRAPLARRAPGADLLLEEGRSWLPPGCRRWPSPIVLASWERVAA